MKILTCPLNGPRPLQEFVFGGEVRSMPNSQAASDKEWADYVFNREGQPGVRKEWWYHVASGTWFIAERDNMKDIIVRTYLYSREALHSGAGAGVESANASFDPQAKSATDTAELT